MLRHLKLPSIIFVGISWMACGGELSEDQRQSEEKTATGAAALGQTPFNVTRRRPEVGTIGNCTGILIHPRWVISASHCRDFFESHGGVGRALGTFRIDDGTAVRKTFNIIRQIPLGDDYGDEDILLLQLETPVPASVATPATIATSRPGPGSPGFVTYMGYGCYYVPDPSAPDGFDTVQDGQKRFLTIRSNATPNRITCAGDSGGPIFWGNLFSNGALIGVHSSWFANNDDMMADVTRSRSRILALIAQWEFFGGLDVSATGFCSSPTAQQYWGDFDADGDIDTYCKDGRSLDLAVRMNDVLIDAFGDASDLFCTHAGAEMHMGDFNGDDISDRLCFDTNNSTTWVEVGQPNTADPFGATLFAARTHFCINEGDELRTGDFDGDGLTDMLCHNRTRGTKAIRFASTTPGRMFTSSSWFGSGNWCTHRGTSLLVGDVNGDGDTDLICHTETNGALSVMESRGNRSSTFPMYSTWTGHDFQFCIGAGATVFSQEADDTKSADLYCGRNRFGHRGHLSDERRRFVNSVYSTHGFQWHRNATPRVYSMQVATNPTQLPRPVQH